jgi:hypothetical protein
MSNSESKDKFDENNQIDFSEISKIETINDFKAFFNDKNIKSYDDNVKTEIIKKFLENDKIKSNISSNQFVDLIKFCDINDNAKKIELLGNFFEINEAEKINSDDFINLM